MSLGTCVLRDSDQTPLTEKPLVERRVRNVGSASQLGDAKSHSLDAPRSPCKMHLLLCSQVTGSSCGLAFIPTIISFQTIKQELI